MGTMAAVVAAVVLIVSVGVLSGLTGSGQDPADSAQVEAGQEVGTDFGSVKGQKVEPLVLAVAEVSPEEHPYTVLKLWDVDGDVDEQMRKMFSLPEIAPIVPTNAWIDRAGFSHEIRTRGARSESTTSWSYFFSLPGTPGKEGDTYVKSLASAGLGSPAYSFKIGESGIEHTYELYCDGVKCSDDDFLPSVVRWTVTVESSAWDATDGGKRFYVYVTGTYEQMTEVPDLKRAVPGLAWLTNLGVPETENVKKVAVQAYIDGGDVSLTTELTIERQTQSYEQVKVDLLGGKTFIGEAMRRSRQGAPDGETLTLLGTDGLLRGVDVEVTVYKQEALDTFDTVYQFEAG